MTKQGFVGSSVKKLDNSRKVRDIVPPFSADLPFDLWLDLYGASLLKDGDGDLCDDWPDDDEEDISDFVRSFLY